MLEEYKREGEKESNPRMLKSLAKRRTRIFRITMINDEIRMVDKIKSFPIFI
jgi:hypothetical protein